MKTMLKTISAAILICLALLAAKPSAVRASDAGPTGQPASEQHSMPTAMKVLLDEPGIEWNTFLAIQAAAAEASRHRVKIENCRIKAAEEGELLVVMFGNPNPSYRWRGCPPGPCRCFDVELAKDGLRVVKAYFGR
jgi:hypothetical protein